MLLLVALNLCRCSPRAGSWFDMSKFYALPRPDSHESFIWSSSLRPKLEDSKFLPFLRTLSRCLCLSVLRPDTCGLASSSIGVGVQFWFFLLFLGFLPSIASSVNPRGFIVPGVVPAGVGPPTENEAYPRSVTELLCFSSKALLVTWISLKSPVCYTFFFFAGSFDALRPQQQFVSIPTKAPIPATINRMSNAFCSLRLGSINTSSISTSISLITISAGSSITVSGNVRNLIDTLNLGSEVPEFTAPVKDIQI